MKQKITYLIFPLVAAILLLSCCTRNNGNIGKQFGQWKVTDIVTDGQPDESYQGNMFWSFQSTTVEMKYVNENHETVTTFGNYRIMDDTLFITFPDEDRQPPQGLGLKPYVENALQIVRLTGSEMILAFDNTDEAADNGTAATTIITLKKW